MARQSGVCLAMCTAGLAYRTLLDQPISPFNQPLFVEDLPKCRSQF
jgi:hypothetical protein